MFTCQYFDIHSHLNFEQFDNDRDVIIAEMKEQEIWTITVGTDLKTSREAVALAQQHDTIFATVGLHPSDIQEPFVEQEYESLLHTSRVVAVGECGLDYFRIDKDDEKTKQHQKEVFEQHIAFAHRHTLPLMIHGRPSKGSMDAYEDILAVLAHARQSGMLSQDAVGNIHFFVGDVGVTKRFLELGFTLSFDGPITFAREYDETIRYIPRDMIMAETDAPFAAPVPYRGQRNSPLYVPYVLQALAEIRNEDLEVLRQATIDTAFRVFRLSATSLARA